MVPMGRYAIVTITYRYCVKLLLPWSIPKIPCIGFHCVKCIGIRLRHPIGIRITSRCYSFNDNSGQTKTGLNTLQKENDFILDKTVTGFFLDHSWLENGLSIKTEDLISRHLLRHTSFAPCSSPANLYLWLCWKPTNKYILDEFS